MKEASEVTYKGRVLIALAIPERGLYASMLITVESDGERRASGTLGMFPSAIQAQDFALQHGMAEIDRRHCHFLTGRQSILPVQKSAARPR